MLRSELQNITDNKDIALHAGLVEGLRRKYGHQIQHESSATGCATYTCGVYAFDLVDKPEYVEIASFGFRRTFAGKEFIDFLLQESLLERLQDDVVGALAIYFDSGQFAHIGRVLQEGRLISKWGEGQLWSHEYWEVPTAYGDVLEFYSVKDSLSGSELFLRYAETQGWCRVAP